MKNLQYCASQVQMDLDDWTTHRRTKIIQYGINCVKQELRYKSDKSVDVAYLTPNAVGNAPFPANYEYYTKVAIKVCGRLITLTLNNDIPLARKYECGVETNDPTCCVDWNNFNPLIYSWGQYFVPHYRAGQFVAELYSLGGGVNEMGYFRVDYKMRQFQFANIPLGAEIVLEYVSDDHTNANTLVYMTDVKPIVAYMHWQLLEHDKKQPAAEKMRKMGLFNAALQERIFYAFAPNISDYLDACWSTYKSTAKR